jgi:hypothetical protein
MNERCRSEVPELHQIQPDHWVACHHADGALAPQAAQ